MSSSHFSSFSSAAGKDAAASNHPGSSSSSGGGGGASLGSTGGAGSGDWTRRVNGTSSSSTRRPSLSTTLTHPTTPLSSGSSNVYHPPHHYNRQGAGASTTYGKEELLNIFKSQESSGGLGKVSDLLESEVTGSGSGGWGRSGDEAINGVELCWEKDGGLKPIGLDEMTEEERELFSGSVNSPHKPTNNNAQGNASHASTPTQNRNKAGSIGAASGSGRPQTGRRRDTSEAGPGANLFNGSPAPLSRRRTDLRDGDEAPSPSRERSTFFGRWGSIAGTDEENKEKDEGTGGTGGRNTGLFRRPSAAWGSSSGGSTLGANGALNSPMGTFGNSAFGGGAMGGFMLQPDKNKATNSTSKGTPSNRPGVDNVDERAEEALPEAVSSTIAELREEENRERPMTGETDPFGGDHGRDQRTSNEDRMKSGSPFGDLSVSTSNQRSAGNMASTPTRQRSDFGFSAFGQSREGFNSTSSMAGLQHQLQSLQFNQQGQVPLRRSREGSLGGILAGDNEPLSPAETNPFTSPPPEKADDDAGNDPNEGGGLGSVIAGLRRGEGANIAQPGSDRSGRSSTAGIGSVGGPLGAGSIGGFGGLGGAGLWGSGHVGTPGGMGGSAGQSFFGAGPLGDFATPGGTNLLGGGLGGIGSGIGGTGFGSASRASRLGQLFQDAHHDEPGYEPDAFKADPRFGAFGSRSRLGGMMDSPMRERGDVADLFGFPNSRSLSNLAGAAAAQDAGLYQREGQDPLGLGQGHQGQQSSPPNAQALSQSGQPLRPPPGNLPLGTVPHVLLMPDKIMWEYRDPTGTVQGPFSGLEMHEWYRAGFFTQDLAVKRVEDSDFEPLGTLVRRIGNTREPFLVPLPGSSAAGATVQPPQPQAASTPGSIQPPFAGSFPTFGTTLTAEQQNALERRKQEEQYLMAKQREYLLQQQIMVKQALHHQSSTKSLHSQASFGSLHSPSTFGPTVTTPAAVLVGNQNAFEPGVLLRQAGAAAGGSDALSLAGMQTPGSQFPQQQQPLQQSQQALQLQQEQQRLAEQQRQQQLQRTYQTQQTAHVEQQLQKAQEQASQQPPQQPQQYVESQPSMESLRDQASFQEQVKAPEQHHQEQQQQSQQPQQQEEEEQEQQQQEQPASTEKPKSATAQEQSKSAPTQKTPSVKSSPAPPKPSQPAWNQPAPLVAPFPPPPGQEHAAPSPTVETPSAPSIAPWANKDEVQPLKTPSLKEIQELEAKQAAARQAAEEQARAAMLAAQPSVQAPPPAPGLPSTATWATSPSTTPAAGASAWNKPLQNPNTPSATQRKTLQQIQKEEEARKAKAAAALASQTVHTAAVPVSTPGGKRYADLASKAAPQQQTPPAVGTGAWTTVGAGGKVKPTGVPQSPVPPPNAPTAPSSKTSSSVKKPVTPTPTAKPVNSSAQEEFLKWCRGSIKGLQGGATPDTVIETLSTFPSDAEIIADTVYTLSSTMDGRRWAEEYIKRREAAGSGVIIEAGTGDKQGGGWNEVAKGRPATQAQPSTVPETNNSFRVVSKKKGRRA